MTPSLELRALNAMNSSGMWFTCSNQGCELRDLEVMDSLGVLLKGSILSCKFSALDGMNNSRLQLI